MKDNDQKKSLSLKNTSSVSKKSTKPVSSSPGITIQVKRKKIINAESLSDNKTTKNYSNNTQSKQKSKPIPNSITTNVPKSNDSLNVKKKSKYDKDSIADSYENKELHLKNPKFANNIKSSPSENEKDLIMQHQFEKPTEPVRRTIEISENITVGDLAQKISVKSSDLIKVMMNMGVMATINQSLDQDTAVLIIEEFGHDAVIKEAKSDEEILTPKIKNTEDLKTRPAVVTIMGHVDHGKTSLLDYIRKTKVASSEAGGITQHIGAYTVQTKKGDITFLDTPGHAAFSAMRARGAQITDIVVLIISADDSVMPQTKEAIEHAQSAKVPIIVAVNKIDKENADPDKVIGDLSQHNIVPEEWGGDTICVKISAHTGQGVDDLLEAISLQAEILELKASSAGPAMGTVIESSLDKGRGPVATVLIQNGKLSKKDYILVGKEFGRVRAMYDEDNKEIASAGPGIPVVITGLSGTPNVAET